MAGLAWFQDGTYSRKQLRQLIGALVGGKAGARPLGGRSGLTSPVSLAVTSTTWTVGAHTWLLDLETDATMGPSPAVFGTSTSGSVTASSGSIDRWDLLSVTMDDATATLPTIVYTAGSTAATLPATPAESVALAKIVVPKTGTGSPTIQLIAPQAAAAGGILTVTDASGYPASPADGQAVYDRALDSVLVYSAANTAWRRYEASIGRLLTRPAASPLNGVTTSTDWPIASWSGSTSYNQGDISYSAGIFTIATPGLYRYDLTVTWPTIAGSTFTTRQFVYLNGAVPTDSEGYDTRWYSTTSTIPSRAITTGGSLVLAAGDTVQAIVRHAYGSSMDNIAPQTFALYRVA